MNVIAGLVRRVIRCPHDATYRERRPLRGTDVMHLVCHDCGRAVPVVDRTADEHRRVVETGALRLPRAHRPLAPVVAIGEQRRSA